MPLRPCGRSYESASQTIREQPASTWLHSERVRTDSSLYILSTCSLHLCTILLCRAGKKSYTFLMGKPNPAKLANFPEVEVFVLVADPDGLILDSKVRGSCMHLGAACR
jgi:Putative diphthamide synthesis protein